MLLGIYTLGWHWQTNSIVSTYGAQLGITKIYLNSCSTTKPMWVAHWPTN